MCLQLLEIVHVCNTEGTHPAILQQCSGRVVWLFSSQVLTYKKALQVDAVTAALCCFLIALQHLQSDSELSFQHSNPIVTAETTQRVCLNAITPASYFKGYFWCSMQAIGWVQLKLFVSKTHISYMVVQCSQREHTCLSTVLSC